MSLFGDLPPPTSHLRPKHGEIENEYKPLPVTAPEVKAEGEDPEDLDAPDRPEKRQRIGANSSGGLSDDQITAALNRIGSHISNPDKFSKAAGLLRQLLDSGALTKAHRDLLFEVVKAAFSDFDTASEPGLRRDYMKLCHSLDKQSDALFIRPQRAQLEVYRIVGFLQNEMHTDDSFVFNKVLGRIKDAVAALPPATEEDEEAMAELQEAAAGSDSSGSDDEGGGVEEESGVGDEGEGEGDGERRGSGLPTKAADGDGGGGGSDAGGSAAAAAREANMEVEEQQQSESGPAHNAAAGFGAGDSNGPAHAHALRSAPDDVNDGGGGGGGGDGDDEADPFGLDQLLPGPKHRSQAAHPPPPPQHHHQVKRESGSPVAGGGGGGSCRKSRRNAWTAAQALVMRRQALVECLITARAFHKTAWARTSVELLVEHYHKHRERFTAEQQIAVDEMVRFVRAARAARPTGPSRKEINRDTTSFERARSEWSRATLSARGKVGASGDAKAQNWLG